MVILTLSKKLILDLSFLSSAQARRIKGFLSFKMKSAFGFRRQKITLAFALKQQKLEMRALSSLGNAYFFQITDAFVKCE